MSDPIDKNILLQLEADLQEAFDRMQFQKLKFYEPYEKQRLFHSTGLTHHQRLLMAGNQTGKTYCGGAEVAMHLTGQYPSDWPGRKWDRPTHWWAAGVTGESTRDVVQQMLMGKKADGFGTGMIPKDCILSTTTARGIADLLDTVTVRHVTGGVSTLNLKSYEKGQEKWQGATLDGVWFDEEPPLDVYSEGFTRTIVKGGMCMVTFTPLNGMSEVVKSFLQKKDLDKVVVSMTIADAKHIPEADRERIIAAYPAHEREARAKGIPVLGSGAVFPVAESQITAKPFRIPEHWSWIWGIDFGVSHPFAAVLCAWDRDTDTVYVVHTIRLKSQTTAQHAASMKPALNDKGGLVPVAWPQDVTQRREFEGDLKPLYVIYRKLGLNMHSQHAQFLDGSNSTEIGVLQMKERMDTGRLKVFETCGDWFEEFRMYHRKEGLIVKEDDDLMSATRQAIMMLRIAKPILYPGYGVRPAGGSSIKIAEGVDDSPFR